jgi:hypothetical protein
MRGAAPLVLLLLAGCGGGHAATRSERRPPPPQAALPSSPATRPPAPQRRWTTARLTGRTALRSAPAGRVVTTIGRRTGFGGRRVMSVLRRRGDWLQVTVPERPNARPGWIPAAAARLGGTDISLRIDRSARTLTVRDGNRVVDRLTVGVGAAAHPTPTGRFAVTDKLRMGGPGTTYGCCALALSGHQPDVPATWDGTDRLAVHGTDAPATIGQAASLGCLHATDRALRRLMREVPIGAPVFVRS